MADLATPGSTLQVLCHIRGHGGGAKQPGHHLVDDVLATVDVVEREPEGRRVQAAGVGQPLHKPSGQSGFANPTQAMDQYPAGRRMARSSASTALSRPMKPYGVLSWAMSGGSATRSRTAELTALPGKGQVWRVLLIDYRHQPVLQGKFAAIADAALLMQHGLAARGFRDAALLEQAAVKRRQKHPAPLT